MRRSTGERERERERETIRTKEMNCLWNLEIDFPRSVAGVLCCWQYSTKFSMSKTVNRHHTRVIKREMWVALSSTQLDRLSAVTTEHWGGCVLHPHPLHSRATSLSTRSFCSTHQIKAPPQGNSSQLFAFKFLVKDRLCGLLLRVPGYRTEMYCVSCEVRTDFTYVM
jgi:hypothetical protein